MTTTGLHVAGLGVVKGGASILRSVTAQFPAGTLSVVIGPNGAGKSTLLRTLAGLETPATGSVRLAGADVQAMPLGERARQIAWVPDHADVPFAFTVLDTVSMGRFPWHQGAPRKADLDLARAAIERLGITYLAERPLTALSSGERQKAMIARALAGDAPVLLFDEPCANLDVGAALRLLKLLTSLAAAGKTVIVTLHDIAMAHRFAEHAVCMACGEVMAEGPRDTVFTPAVLDKVFQVRTESAMGLRFDV